MSKNNAVALITLALAFFAWGFLMCLSNAIVTPALKAYFHLNYAEAMRVQLCFFGAYGSMSIPMAKFLRKFGYQSALAYGFMLSAAGCVLLWPAALSGQFAFFLLGFFILASGCVMMEVASNPAAMQVGDQNHASGRLTFLQGFNALATAVAPLFGAALILGSTDQSLLAIAKSYLGIAIVLLACGLFTLKVPFPAMKIQHKQQVNDTRTIWSYPHFLLGVLAIFLDVGAEIGIGSLLVNFMESPDVANFTAKTAANYVVYYWGGMMTGRFLGAFLMRIIPAKKVLLINALIAFMLVILSLLTHGYVSMWSMLAIGLFNSIMFPVIFSLAIRDLGSHTAQGSGLLCVAIIGGAILPLLQGVSADHFGIKLSFMVPLACYLFIAYYAKAGHRRGIEN